eukprot:12523435-Ditylum_brightwellii.AAC.1
MSTIRKMNASKAKNTIPIDVTSDLFQHSRFFQGQKGVHPHSAISKHHLSLIDGEAKLQSLCCQYSNSKYPHNGTAFQKEALCRVLTDCMKRITGCRETFTKSTKKCGC